MVDNLIEDRSIYPALIRLAACLCQEMDAVQGPELCYCGPIAGEVVMDFCGNDCSEGGCGGQAWVRFVDAFPSSIFPSLDGTLNNCKAPFGGTLEIGVARCAPMGSSGPNGYMPPTMEENVSAIRLQLADMAAMRRAVQCCFGTNDTDYILGAYSPGLVGGGGCLGGTFTVQVWEAF